MVCLMLRLVLDAQYCALRWSLVPLVSSTDLTRVLQRRISEPLLALGPNTFRAELNAILSSVSVIYAVNSVRMALGRLAHRRGEREYGRRWRGKGEMEAERKSWVAAWNSPSDCWPLRTAPCSVAHIEQELLRELEEMDAANEDTANFTVGHLFLSKVSPLLIHSMSSW